MYGFWLRKHGKWLTSPSLVHQGSKNDIRPTGRVGEHPASYEGEDAQHKHTKFDDDDDDDDDDDYDYYCCYY